MRNTTYKWLCLWRGRRIFTVAPTLMQARDNAQYYLWTLSHLRANQEDITAICKCKVK